MNSFINVLDVFGKEVQIKELLLKDYKTILKCLFGDTPNVKNLFENIDIIMEKYSSLDSWDIEELDFIDYLIILAKIRNISLSGVLKLRMEDNGNLVTLNLNLSDVIETFYNFKKDFLNNSKISFGEYVIEYRLPTLSELASCQYDDRFELDATIFLDEIHHNSENICVIQKNLPISDRNELFNKLPAKYSLKVVKDIKALDDKLKKINLINLLNHPDIGEKAKLPFDFNINNIIFLIKIMFSDDLMTMYESFYTMSEKMSPEYLDNCTPGEFGLFIKIYESKLKQQNSNRQNVNNIEPSPMDNFEQTVENSEFTP